MEPPPLDSGIAPAPTPAPKRQTLAPAWHTIVFVVVLFALSIPGAKASGHGHRPHVALYAVTIVMEWLYVAYIAWGLHMRGRRLRNLIGGRWRSAEDVITDLGLGVIFFFLNAVLRAAILLPLFAIKGDLQGKAEETYRIVQNIGPRSTVELFLFLGLALTAGICEEIMFRGYLQQQIVLWTGSMTAGVVLSTFIFGISHAYQGWFGMVVVGTYGLTLAILAVWRRSLRPGMIAHAWQDMIAGLITHILSKSSA